MGIPSRKSKKIPLRNYIRIYSNGKTEIEYFQSKKAELRIRNIIVEPSFENAGNPKKILEIITKKNPRSNFQDGDRIFCVVDVDEATDEIIQEGLRIKASYIELILSNPNFEIWFLLHFKPYTSSIMMEETLCKLQEHIPKYSKTQISPFFPTLLKNEQKAIDHAQQLRKNHRKSEVDLDSRNANPYTSVDVVVELLNSSA